MEGTEDAFCCSGCEAAFALLHDLGLEDWYERREQAGARPQPSRHSWDAVAVDEIDGLSATTLVVDGLRCTSCTWVVEHVLQRTEGVERAQVSYASGRARLRWDPAVVSLEELAGRVAAVGYSPRPVMASAPPDPLLFHLGVALFCTANLMLLTAGLYASWIDGMEPRFQVLFRWLALALATPVALWSASPFLRGAVAGLRLRKVGMDVPIALAVVVLYAHGVVQTMLGGEAYLDSLGMLVSLLLVGRILEGRGRRSTSDAAAAIAAHLTQRARRRTPLGVEDVDPTQLVPGDVLELGPGSEVAADGVLVEGCVQLQTALLTGEMAPRLVAVGEPVLAGAVVLEGSGAARVEMAGENTVAMRMSAAVREAIDRPTAPNPASELAPAFTLITVGVAVVAGALWTVFDGPHAGIEVAVAVLVVACPCALGLSVPLGMSVGLGTLARRGVLLRDGDALLRLAEIDTVALDKTGTLTLGEPRLVEASDEVLRVAAALERASSHPLARAITRAAVERGIPLPFASLVVETPGVGVTGMLDGARFSLRSDGVGALLLQKGDLAMGSLRFADTLRDDARSALGALRDLGLEVVILSGDAQDAATSAATELGVSHATGALLPEQKVAALAAYGPTLFVGDGLNDGPALASAHVGLAMHTGAGSSLSLADGVVSTGGLAPVVSAVRIARRTQRVIRANLRRSLAYNVVAVTAAALGLVNPLVAAVLMPISSGMVLLGAQQIAREET